MATATRRTPVSVVDELVALFTAPEPGKNRWFVRKMKNLPESQQEEVWDRLAGMGHERPGHKAVPEPPPPPTPPPTPRQMVTWSEDEWDRLATSVWRARKNDPSETLIGLCRKVMGEFPLERRRTIRMTNEVKPLMERLTGMDRNLLALEATLSGEREVTATLQAQITEYRTRPTPPTREEIIGTLTDEEVSVFFTDKVLSLMTPDDYLKKCSPELLLSYVPLADVLSAVFKSGVEIFTASQARLTGAVEELTGMVRQQKQSHLPVNGNGTKPAHSRPSMPTPIPHKPRLPRVTVLGLLPEQAKAVESKLKGRAYFNFVDKNRDSQRGAEVIPKGQDIIVLAAKFISHSMQDQAKRHADDSTRVIVHHGGTDMMARKLDELLPQLEVI